MARTITAGQIAQKEAANYKDVILVVITTATNTIRYATEAYVLSGNTYENSLMDVGPVTMSIGVGGGLASTSDWTFQLLNTNRLSDIADAYVFDNKQVDCYLIFQTGSETDADRIQLTSQVVRGLSHDDEVFTMSTRDATQTRLVPIPRERVDLATFPNAPIEDIGKPLPVVFGVMDDRPLNFYLLPFKDRKIVPGVCIDQFAPSFILGNQIDLDLDQTILNRFFTYYEGDRQFSQPYWYSINKDARGYEYVTIDQPYLRNLFLHPYKVVATGGATSPQYARDKDSSVACGVIDNGTKNFTAYFGSVSKLGTLTGADGFLKVYIASTIANPLGMGLTIRHPRLTTINTNLTTGSYTFSTGDRDLISDQWDFEGFEIDVYQGTGGGNVTVYEISLNVMVQQIGIKSFEGHERVFGSFEEGYSDEVAQYYDGSAIDGGAGDMLHNPVHQLLAIMRDKKFGMGVPTATIDTASAATAATDLGANVFDWVFTEYTGDVEGTRTFLDNFCREAQIAMFHSFEGKWKFKSLVLSAPTYFFGQHNIVATNPEGDAKDQKSSITVKASELSNVYNDYQIHYGWNYGRESYDLFKAATGRYLASGTNATTNASPGTTFTSSGATFLSSFVLAGHYVYVRSGSGAVVGTYLISSVTSETVLVLATSPGNSLTALEYYVGPYLDEDCVESFLKYGELNTYPAENSNWKFIQDETTAVATLASLISTHAQRRWIVNLDSWWNAIDVEVGDIVLLDDSWIPYKSQKRSLGGTLTTTINSSTTSVVMTGGTMPTVGDYLQLDNEIMTVTSIAGAPTISVTRATSGSVAAAHTSGITMFWHPTKWRVHETTFNTSNPQAASHFVLRQENIAIVDAEIPSGQWVFDRVSQTAQAITGLDMLI